jgi:N-acyl amino acid synthase of PEP-CTERM/exosortase system
MTDPRSLLLGGLPGTNEMHPVALSGELPATVMRYWRVSILRTVEELEAAYALRYRVYCEERGFLAAGDCPDGKEHDEFDDYSLHFGSFNVDGEMVGTARLVMRSPLAYPMYRHCTLDPPWHDKLEAIPRLVEISRLVVSRQYRRRAHDGHYGIEPPNDDASPLQSPSSERREQFSVAVSLFKAMYHAAWRLQVTHALSAMELTLLRLLQRYHFPFEKIGPECDYFGPVTPFLLDVARTEEQLAADNPGLLQEFHQGLSPGQTASLII